MRDNVVIDLLPVLTRPAENRPFSLFDVLHHGTHEKQLSNLFAWLLKEDETHELGNVPAAIFIDEINSSRIGAPIKAGEFTVLQEQNTAAIDERADIADIVLVDKERRVAIVVENFHTSDGHGHSYEGYLNFGRGLTDGGTSIVTLLCSAVDRTQLESGWEHAPVVTYRSLVARICDHVDGIAGYRDAYPDQAAFFDQMRSQYAKGDKVSDETSIEFVKQMCAVDKAELYGQSNQAAVEEEFAEGIKQETLRQIRESRAMLIRVKAALKEFCTGSLKAEIQATLGHTPFDHVRANWRGTYQWKVVLLKTGAREDDPIIEFRFGPTAWLLFADPYGEYPALDRSGPTPDFEKLLLVDPGRTRFAQSAVSMGEVLSGLDGDGRLAEEIVAFLDGDARSL